MKLDESKLRDALRTIYQGPLTAADAAAIVDVARYAASVDGRMDMGEMATVARLSKIIYAISGQDEVPVPSTPVAASWLLEIDRKLPATGPRELAYAAARLIILADRKVTKEESELAAQLTGALRISAARAKELDGIIDGVVAATR